MEEYCSQFRRHQPRLSGAVWPRTNFVGRDDNNDCILRSLQVYPLSLCRLCVRFGHCQRKMMKPEARHIFKCAFDTSVNCCVHGSAGTGNQTVLHQRPLLFLQMAYSSTEQHGFCVKESSLENSGCRIQIVIAFATTIIKTCTHLSQFHLQAFSDLWSPKCSSIFGRPIPA